MFTDNVNTLATGQDFPRAIGFTPSGSLVYFLTTKQLWSMPTGGGAVSILAGHSWSGFKDANGTVALFRDPSGLVVHPVTGVAYITDSGNHRIRTCTPDGQVSTLAGNGTIGNIDGAAFLATFNYPWGIVMDPTNQYLYVVCYNANTLRQVSVNTGRTTTIAGSGAPLSIDGTGLVASFIKPMYVCIGDDHGVGFFRSLLHCIHKSFCMS